MELRDRFITRVSPTPIMLTILLLGSCLNAVNFSLSYSWYSIEYANVMRFIIFYLRLPGVKLRSKPVVVAVAAQIYHQFYAAAVDNSYDPFVGIFSLMLIIVKLMIFLVISKLIASTCLYVASKQEDDPLKIRDLINVVYRTLNRDSDVLELGEDYWNHRDSIVQAELLVMRLISFRMPSPKSHLVCLTHQ